MKYLCKKWIFVSLLPLIASCDTEPKNPNSFEYFKWHNDNYQWGKDKYGDNLSLDECDIKLGDVEKTSIFYSQVYLYDTIRARIEIIDNDLIKKVDMYFVYFPLESNFYPLLDEKKIKLNVLQWRGKVKCESPVVFDGVMVVQSVQILGEK